MPPKAPTAAYGAACSNCSRAKCRCVIRGPGEACQRCLRLGKECRAGVSGRRLAPRTTEVSKVAKLEAKIDGLMTLLAATGRVVTGSARTNPVSSGPANCSSSPANSSSYATTTLVGDTPLTLAILDLDPSPKEAEESLREFRTKRLPYFPFVHIPFSTTPEKLREERPFLWLCIIAVCAKSISKQTDLYTRIRELVAKKVVAEFERSVDLLLGLLTCIGWANLQFQRRPFLTTYTQLANSVVYSLGLNHAPRKCPDEAAKYRLSLPQVLSVRTLEDHRAALACFLSNSLIRSPLHMIDPMNWTPYLEESLELVMTAKECPGDEMLVAMVRLRLIVEQARRSPWHSEVPGQGDMSKRPPPAFYLTALESELRATIERFPLTLRRQDAVALQIHLAEVAIRAAYLSSAIPPSTMNSDFGRIEGLYACLASAKATFDHLFTIPTADYAGFPSTLFFQLGRCAATLFKLSALDDPAWNRAAAVRLADVFGVSTRFANNIGRIASLAGLEVDGEDEDVYSRASGLMLTAARSWQARLLALDERGDEDQGAARLPEQGQLEAADRSEENAEWDLDIDLEMTDDAWVMGLITGWA